MYERTFICIQPFQHSSGYDLVILLSLDNVRYALCNNLSKVFLVAKETNVEQGYLSIIFIFTSESSVPKSLPHFLCLSLWRFSCCRVHQGHNFSLKEKKNKMCPFNHSWRTNKKSFSSWILFLAAYTEIW